MDARAVAVACMGLLACGSEPTEPVEPVELAELCGQTEPVRLLPYLPWRRYVGAGAVGVFGDRRLVIVHYADTIAAPQVLWSVGLCGEDPRQLLSGNFYVWTVPGQDWPFACKHSSGELFVIDPSGERAPRLLARLAFGCNATRTDFGLFTIATNSEEDITGDLVAYPWPSDIWTDELELVTVAEGVRDLRGSSGELFFVNADDELTRMDIEDSSLELVAPQVSAFTIGYVVDDAEEEYSARYVLWQGIASSNGDPDNPEGEITLLDRTTAQLSSLGHGSLTSAHLGATNWIESGIVQLPVRVDDELVLRLFQLPSLSHVDVDVTIEPRYMLDDDRHLVVRFGEDGPFGTLDVQTGEIVSLQAWFSNPGLSYWHEPRALALLPAAGGDRYLAESEVWVIRDGGRPELFANRATQMHELMPDGRLLTGIDLDRNATGNLIVVDDFEERLIDRGVLASYMAEGPAVGDNMVMYSILDGERAGLWLVRLPPRD